MTIGTRSIAALAAVAVAIGLAAAACAVPGSQVRNGTELAGTYTLNGTDPEGNEYAGTMVITATDDPATYAFQWLITEGLLQGTGTVSGDRVTVEWSSDVAGSAQVRGTATYTVDGDGNLTGTRTVEGVDGVAREEIFQKP